MLKIDSERPLKVFTVTQVHEAGMRVQDAMKKRFGDSPEVQVLVIWSLASLMVELGVKGPEDFYIA